MTIHPIVARHNVCKSYTIDSTVSDYLYYIDDDYKEQSFYISPEFASIKLSNSMSTLNPKFILFSAAGAAGKTALAKYLAIKFNALYWDLSKIKLGDNSFDGTIIKALSRMGYSSFLEDLNQAKVLLVIDAFDEAEMISGRAALASFINDANNVITSHTLPPIFLFARTESAQFISSICDEYNIPINHYEIGFFEEGNAKEFITESFKQQRNKVKKATTITASVKKCIDQYYDTVSKNIGQRERQSFLGYAPVLQAIAQHICDITNTQALLNSLAGKKECTSIMFEIMTSLLERERGQKFVSGLKVKLSKKNSDYNEWDKLYTENEQLTRLIYLILFENCDYSNYTLDCIPLDMIDDYQEQLKAFLPQHPFIQMIKERGGAEACRLDFTGPAFRDYALAKLLYDQHDAEAELYWESHAAKNGYYIPSQLFFDYYCKLSNNTVRITHLSYLFDSFRAKAKAFELPYMQCSEVNSTDSGEITCIAIFGMNNLQHDQAQDERVLNVIIDNNYTRFSNISNIVLDLPSITVSIGKKDAETRISRSSINCRSILWNAEHIQIDTYPSSGCLLACNENASGSFGQIDINGDNLKVSIPNIREYPRLVAYENKQEDATHPDIISFLYSLRRILTEFRTDKKDTLGKHYEKIENVVVGENSLRRSVLEYLKDRKIIVLDKSANQYLIDIEKMREASIGFAFLSQMREDRIMPAYNDFCSWLEQH